MSLAMATKTKSFPVPPAMLSAIKRWAETAGTSDSDVIRVAIQLGLRALQADPSPLMGAEQDLGPPPNLASSDSTEAPPDTRPSSSSARKRSK